MPNHNHIEIDPKKMEDAIRIFKFDLRQRVTGIWDENIPIIRHSVIECAGVLPAKLQNKTLLKILEKILKSLDLNIVSKHFHSFKPQGQSFLFILKESHLAVHSWPEKGYVHTDLVTCSKDEIALLKIAEIFSKTLEPVSTRIINFKY